MKYMKVAAIILGLLIAVIAIRNKIQLDRCTRDCHIAKETLVNTKETNTKIEEALIQAQYAAMIHLGTTIKLVNMKKIFPASSNPEEALPGKHPKLLLVFSELSCNVCQDEETRFGVSIANEYGPEFVMAVVYATNRQYVGSYVRLNQINFPVFYCQDESFMKENGIKNTPMIFVLDEENRVIASNFPLPGHLEYSEPIHRFCYHYFNKSK